VVPVADFITQGNGIKLEGRIKEVVNQFLVKLTVRILGPLGGAAALKVTLLKLTAKLSLR
jgi:hypothetical protein